jgi:YD repeat-containing protein
VPFTPPNGRSYLLQYWTYTGGAWAFTQTAYTGPAPLSGQIDDVRVFPKDALMTTYTYNPLVGKTSETDPSGRSTIYQYDGLNRLATVRDQDNNIIKQFDYEYQTCATMIDNASQEGAFVRNNCTGGQYGSYVLYTVAANRYNACTLAAANQMADNDLALNGQIYANNNGACTVTAPCIPPNVVTASALGATITVNWNYPPGVGTNAYAVDVYNAATGAPEYDDHGAASPLTINSANIVYNTTYNVVVTSLCGSSPASLPVQVTTTGAVGQAVNLVSASSIPSGFCCHGCQYTSTVYANTPTIGPGTLLYTNQALTTPVSGMNYIFPYNNNPNNYVYTLSGNVVQSAPTVCP